MTESHRSYEVEARAVGFDGEEEKLHSRHKNLKRTIQAGSKKEAVAAYMKLRLFPMRGEKKPCFFLYIDGEQWWRGSPDWEE